MEFQGNLRRLKIFRISTSVSTENDLCFQTDPELSKALMFPGFLSLCGFVSIEYMLLCKEGKGTHIQVLSLNWIPYGTALMEVLALPLWPFLRLYIINMSHLHSLGMSKTSPPLRIVEYSGIMFNSPSRLPHLL